MNPNPMPMTSPPPTAATALSQIGSSPQPSPLTIWVRRPTTAAPAQSVPWTRPVSGFVREPWDSGAVSESGAMALAELGQAVAQAAGLVGRQTGDVGGRLRACGVQRDRRDAEPAVDRARLHVDELHPPVRHRHEPPEQDAAGDQEVVLLLGVAPA